MKPLVWMLALVALLVAGCGDDKKKKGAGDAGPDAGPDPVLPVIGELGTAAVDCTGAYTYPAELTNEEGLGHHGWDLDDLDLTLAWPLGNRFGNNWISDNTNTTPSLRIQPWLAPEAGYCYRDGLVETSEGSAQGTPVLAGVLSAMSAFAKPESTYDTLERDLYTPPEYDFAGGDPLVLAVEALFATPNDLPGAPAAEWDDAHAEQLDAISSGLGSAASEALALLVLSLGEAYLVKQQLLEAGDAEAFEAIHSGFVNAYYGSSSNWTISPGFPVAGDIIEFGDLADLRLLYGAALAVTDAADRFRQAAAASAPFASAGLDLVTPHGRLLIETADEDTDYTAEDLVDAVLVIDLGGNDSYGGRYAATHQFWMSASVLIDIAGDDEYTPEVADIEASSTTTIEAFAEESGFTQGCGVFGVGLLIDAAGNDLYTASTYAQGASAFGVGVLQDLAGIDSYKIGTAGQGSGYFGIGLLMDVAGSDRYGVFTVGQGAGRAKGHGLLFDLAGDDTYIGYYAGGEPELPGPGYNNYYNQPPNTGYHSADGTPHYMSIAQGVGWGFRGDWFWDSQVNWMGGFGALVDLGDGADEHYADCMAMGQGFVYGFGFLYDDGGDDKYRTFWWGPAAAAHMGVGLLIEEDGDDDLHVTRLSGGYGYDCSVGWTVDNGGNDTYGGQFNYGRGYTYGMTFFVNDGGDDVYNAGEEQTDPRFGVVDYAFPNVNLAGVFIDLGGGTDTYYTSIEGVGNDSVWYLDPVGQDADPAFHKGVGIDK
jgi:hypothetical protein